MDQIWLFSYGTLRQPAVQQAVFGREPETVDELLTGFQLDIATITDPDVIAMSGSNRHPILRRSPDAGAIAGSALALSAEEIAAADRYEADDYQRVKVVLASGREAFVYVHRDA